MKKFDYSFLKTNIIPGKIINLLTGIYSINEGDVSRRKQNENVYNDLEKIAIVQSVKASNAIEGILTTDERINAIINQNSSPLNHDEIEIVGYRDVLNIIHKEYMNSSFNEKNILSFHNMLLQSTKFKNVGQYKTDDNVIMEVKQDGTRSVRFSPVSKEETKDAMQQLVLAYLDASSDFQINPLLLIPCVILDFLCIHPFSDGNGRMSRLLSLLLLYKAGFDVGKYISFEEQINNRKWFYYEALRNSSINWHENTNDYFFFIENFLITLFDCYKELDKRFAAVNYKKISKSARIEKTILNSLLPISKSEICKILPDVSPTTVELILGKMTKSGTIVKIGSARNIKYLKK